MSITGSIEGSHWLKEIRPWRKGACKSNLCDKRFHRASGAHSQIPSTPAVHHSLPSKNGVLSVLQEMKLLKPISLGKVLERRSDRGKKEKSETRRLENEWTVLRS